MNVVDGVWKPDKTPTAFRYTLELRCAVCPTTAWFEGEYTVAESEAIAPFDVGAWRIFDTPRAGHSDPLRMRGDQTVVCSRACFARLYDLI